MTTAWAALFAAAAGLVAVRLAGVAAAFAVLEVLPAGVFAGAFTGFTALLDGALGAALGAALAAGFAAGFAAALTGALAAAFGTDLTAAFVAAFAAGPDAAFAAALAARRARGAAGDAGTAWEDAAFARAVGLAPRAAGGTDFLVIGYSTT